MTSRRPGLLAVLNDIAADHEGEFNAWYDEEHFPERLGVPGFLTARRYRDAVSPHRYAAVYDTASVAVLTSPAYLERLANPTPRTRGIMPRFSNMTRAACEIAVDVGGTHAPGSALAWLELGDALAESARDALAAAAAQVGRIRVAVPDGSATHVPNPESKFRSTPDRLPPPFTLVEGDDERAVLAAAERIGKTLGAPQPARLFRLLLAQESPAGRART